ncbi:MAG: aminoglycoside phosphotransferase family protein [Bacteroidales bacterium]|nr:aminoglycoside phosphotransferase family protein [Bacteroidales bacterium]
MDVEHLIEIVKQFQIVGTVSAITPLGNGLINDTYRVKTLEADAPDYVLQRINHLVFKDVELLQHNIEAVTNHVRRKLLSEGVSDADRKVLRFIPTFTGKTYHFDGQNYWRVSVYIADTVTVNEVTPQSSYDCGRAFGRFQEQLIDIQEPLGETIPDFHNMELRLHQLKQAVNQNIAGRLNEVTKELELIEAHAEEMCVAERLHRKGLLPKRICHCDTKVNNMLFDKDGNVLCIIDLDTVMPAFVFSDYGDFLRTAANSEPEDSPELDRITFRWDIYEAFTRGYLESTVSFLTPIEREHLPFAVSLFPMMQAVRFLTDYLNGDTYYKTLYPEHNLVRTRNQLQYFREVEARREEMRRFVKSL